MRINDNHMYHGAALVQIAEHPQFTAINAIRNGHEVSRSAFMINADIGIYLKYATEPVNKHDEYIFTFNQQHLGELDALVAKYPKTHLALVCVRGRHVCCLAKKRFDEIRQRRRAVKGEDELQYSLFIQLPTSKSFRVYMSAPGKKNTPLGTPQKIPRNAFPDVLFLS